MSFKPHSPDWYDRLANSQEGYYYPWQSILPPNNGEDTYLEMVFEYISPDKDVLDVGCGHGSVVLEIAPYCKSIFAYDRVASYIDLAQKTARTHKIYNVTFKCADSSATANNGMVRIPTVNDAFDLLISRRGPLHWIEDARRVASPGAVLLQLNPMETPIPVWNAKLPEQLRLPEPGNWTLRQAVEKNLEIGGLKLHSCWTFDVPETFNDPEQLYIRLSWGFAQAEVPSWAVIKETFKSIFIDFGGPEGFELRHRRFLWKAIIET